MNNPTVIDLFSGCGGFSEGFRQQGYNILLATDYDQNSANTYQTNHPETPFIYDDITNISPQQILNQAHTGSTEVDVIIGGPPCQGFSLAGDRDETDSRNKLFKQFAIQIEHIRPKIFVMENVTGLLSMETPDGNPVINDIQQTFQNIGYTTEYKTLTASEYGAPQNRDRVFIIGTRLDQEITFPDPTHTQGDYVTVGDALSDLPSLQAGESITNYTKPPQNEFQEQMRTHTDNNELHNHNAVNHRSHIVERFSHIPQGGNMKDAPDELQPNKIYSSRNRRLRENKPSYTVTSHVLDELLHPWDDRAVTVREAARLQCFPDQYKFTGKRNVFHGDAETSQYEQVGNAVPIALSSVLASHLKNQYL